MGVASGPLESKPCEHGIHGCKAAADEVKTGLEAARDENAGRPARRWGSELPTLATGRMKQRPPQKFSGAAWMDTLLSWMWIRPEFHGAQMTTAKPTAREALKALVEVGDAVASELVTHEARDSVGGVCGTARNVDAAWQNAARAAREVLARGEVRHHPGTDPRSHPMSECSPERCGDARSMVIVGWEAMTPDGAVLFTADDGVPEGSYNVRPLRYADE